jgi:hypothetical protein
MKTRIIRNSFVFLMVFFFTPLISNAAQIYLLPQEINLKEGQTFIQDLRLDTDGEQINALDIELLFNQEVLEIVDILDSKSFLNLWVQKPSFSNTNGNLIIQGGVIGGYAGDGLILQIVFRAKKKGFSTVSFNSNSKVLLHNGEGTPARGLFSGSKFNVLGEKDDNISIFSKTHKREEYWHQNNKIEIFWEASNKNKYSYIFSRDIPENPDDYADDIKPFVYTNPSDGIYYFSIKESKDNGLTWGQIERYRILQDRTPPEKIEIILGQEEKSFDGKFFIAFNSNDKASGLDYYEVRENNLMNFLLRRGSWLKTANPYPLSEDGLGNIIEVKAVDKAGNIRTGFLVPDKFNFFFKPTLISSLVVVLLFFLIRKYKKRK